MLKDHKALELDKILLQLANETTCPDAAELAQKIEPDTDIRHVERLLQETDDAFVLMAKYGAPSFYGMTNVTNALRRAEAGGVLNLESIANVRLLQIVYIFTFCGFGVKAAVFLVHSWLPEAAVAPTPVTALLHAVAVVKSGVFGITRVTYFTFGADFLRGTWAQYAAIAIALFTILYGSSLAARERHFKRRLAWSTVANLSYILFGVLLLSPSGLASGMMHMLFHAFMKITLFYCAGAVLYKTEREYLSELDGLGYRMPVTFVCYTVSALALTGVPPLSGFYSKFALGAAGILDGGVWGIIGTVILLASALLTAIYALYPAVRAFLPQKGAVLPPKDIHDPNAYMLVPMIFTSAATVLFGLFSGGIYDWLYRIASGVFGGGL